MADVTGQVAVPDGKATSPAVEKRPAGPDGATGADRRRKPAEVARSARLAAAFVMAFYFGMVAFMMSKRADAQWDHMNSLLGGLQAIVFGAAGVLFGTSIQRESVARATADAANARNEVEQERLKSMAAERRAAGGEAMATVARGTQRTSSQPSDPWGGAYRSEDDEAPRPSSPERAEAELRASQATLVALADEYFPLADKAGDRK